MRETRNLGTNIYGDVHPMSKEQIREATAQKLTTRQVAEIMGVSMATVRAWIIDGALTAECINETGNSTIGRWYIESEELERFNAKNMPEDVRIAVMRKLPRILWHKARGEKF